MAWRQSQHEICVLAAYLQRTCRRSSISGSRSISSNSRDWDVASPIEYWRADVPRPPRSVARRRLSTFQLSFRVGTVLAIGGGFACLALNPGYAGSLQANAQVCLEEAVRHLKKLLNINPTSAKQPQPALAAKMFQAPDTSSKMDRGSDPNLGYNDKEVPPDVSESPKKPLDDVVSAMSPDAAASGTIPQPEPGSIPDKSVPNHEHTASNEEQEANSISMHERLRSALEQLVPVLGRASTALSSSTFDTTQVSKEEIRSTTEQLPHDIRSASKLTMAPVLHTEGVMGIKESISPASLLKGNPEASKGDAASLGTATRQAAADVEEIRRYLGQVEKNNQKELEKAVAEEQRLEALAREKLSVASNALQHAQSALESTAQAAERNADAAVQLQELHLTVKFEAAANKERAKRLSIIDEVRMDVNALHAGHESMEHQLMEAAQRNAEAAAVVKLCSSLRKGHVSAEDVVEVVKGDTHELTAVAVSSVLPAATNSGLTSVVDLQQRWPGIRRSIRAGQALSSQPQSGFFSTCLATLSASLKVSEASKLQLGKQDTMETKLAAVDQAMAGGDVLTAGNVLEEVCSILKVESNVSSYVESLRTRAAVDQFITVLLAHQTALAAVH